MLRRCLILITKCFMMYWHENPPLSALPSHGLFALDMAMKTYIQHKRRRSRISPELISLSAFLKSPIRCYFDRFKTETQHKGDCISKSAQVVTNGKGVHDYLSQESGPQGGRRRRKNESWFMIFMIVNPIFQRRQASWLGLESCYHYHHHNHYPYTRALFLCPEGNF